MNHASVDNRSDVVVVGAGLAGIAAARLLQRRGRSVVVIDGASPGGRASTDERAGFLFNRGPHALYLGGPARRVLEDLAVPLVGGPPSSDGGGTIGDRIGRLPFGAASLARTNLVGSRGKVALGRLLARFAKVDTATLGSITFADWVADQELPPDAEALVHMLSRVSSYANAPQLASADVVVAQMQIAMAHGVRYLHGGWQSLVDSLAAGVRIERRAAVEIGNDGAAVVVRCADDSRVIASACVVAAGGPAAAATLLGRAPFDVGPPVEAACLDLGTSRPSSPGLLLGVDQPLYLSNHCPPARLAPDGQHVVHVARYLAPDDAAPFDAQRAELHAHAARAGLTSEHIVQQRYLHRMTVVSALAVARNGGLPGRPTVNDSGLDGVFLAGDWVGPHGHLLDASIASAEAAAERADRAVGAATLVL